MKKTISIILTLFIIVSGILVGSKSSLASDSKTVSGSFNYTYAAEVLKIVNNERAKAGLKELVLTKSLTDSAMLRAAETTVSFSHTRPNGEECFTAFEWTSAAGENIAYGQRSPNEVMNGWMNSSGHRANILNSSFTTIGIGCFEYGGRLYWTQLFSGGKGNAYTPDGKNAATVEVSLMKGVLSKLISSDKTEPTTAKPTATSSVKTTASSTVKPTTKPTVSTTAKSTTKSTTKPTTSTTVKSTTKQTSNSTENSTSKQVVTKNQTIIINRKNIFDIINSIIKRFFN